MHLLSTKSRVIFAVLTMLLGLTACGQGREENNADGLQVIKERGVLRVAVFADKPPFGYIDEHGKSRGYDVTLAHRLAQDLLGDAAKVEFVLTEAQNRVDVLKANKVDITLANFTRTEERARQVDFALPYMKTAVGLVSPKNAVINNLAELKDQTVIVNKGTTAELWFTKAAPQVSLLSFDQNTEAFNAMKDGRGAALAHDNTLLYAWVHSNPDFTVSILQLGTADFIAPAVKKGNVALKNWLDGEITRLTAAGFFLQNYKHNIAPFYGPHINPYSLILKAQELK